MKALVVSGFGTCVSSHNNSIEIANVSERQAFPLSRFDYTDVIIEGSSGTISFEALRALSNIGANVCMLRWADTPIGSWMPRGPAAR